MSRPASRTRLDLNRLDDRTVPSTVTATTTARPFEFTGTGTLHAESGNESKDGTPETISDATVTVTGKIDYTSNTDGQSGTVTVSGTGTGTAGDASFAHTLQGQFAFTDAKGVVTTTDPLTGTGSHFRPDGTSETVPVGPHAMTGTLAVSTFKLQANWAATDETGRLSVTLKDKTTEATDLAFGDQSAFLAADGTVGLDFTVAATGKLMSAPSPTAAVTRITAVWEGGGKSEAVELDVPVYWNSGEITVEAAGLTPPAWAKTLTVHVDADDDVTEADETNNTWTLTLADLPPEDVPTDPQNPDDPGEPTTPPVEPTDPTETPRVPGENREWRPTGFSVRAGDRPMVEWRDETGRVIGNAEAFQSFTGPVGIGAGDVNRDGVLDVAVGAGDGGGPRVRVLDGKTGEQLSNFFAFDPSFRGGVSVVVADLNRDGAAEVIVGAGAGGGPHVRVFDGATGQLLNQFFAYAPESRGGVNVAVADLDGDGVAEVVTGAGAGGGTAVKVFDGLTGTERLRVYAAPEDDRNGVRVSTGTDASGLLTVTAEPDDGALVRFRRQLFAGEQLLVELTDGLIVVPPPPPVA